MQNLIITLLICSVTMSGLALVYMAATPFLAKRYSEKWRYYAWLIIIIGLIIPFRPQFSNAIFNVEVSSNVPLLAVQTNGETPNFYLPFIDNVIVYDAPSKTALSIWQIVSVVWLAGAIMFIFYQSIKHYRFVKTARRWSESVKDEYVLSLLESHKSEMGIKRRIPLYLCECVGSPMMIGLIKPQILLPTTELAQDEFCFILKHELVHYKRKDLLYKYLVLAAMTLHWFNPIVCLIAKAINNLCEMSCDTEVVKIMDADMRLSYSETIIGVVKYQSRLKTALSTNFYGGKKSMKNRISSIMDMKKKRRGFTIICMAIILTIGTGFVVAANNNTQEVSENNYTIYAPDNSENARWWPVPESWGLRPFNSDRTVSISLPISISLGEDGTSITSRDEFVEQFGLYVELDPEHQDMSFSELVVWFIANSEGEIISSLVEQDAPQWIIDAFRDALN